MLADTAGALGAEEGGEGVEQTEEDENGLGATDETTEEGNTQATVQLGDTASNETVIGGDSTSTAVPQ